MIRYFSIALNLKKIKLISRGGRGGWDLGFLLVCFLAEAKKENVANELFLEKFVLQFTKCIKYLEE